MKIQKIPRISGCAVFRDFIWPNYLPEFKRYNLIYGWNWSGKTVLSNIFRALSMRRVPNASVIQLEFSDGRILEGDEFSSDVPLPDILVFNRDFMQESVFGTVKELDPIFVLGEKSVEKQKDLEKLRAERESKSQDYGLKINERKKIEDSVEKFSADQAKTIKEALRSSGPNPYNNYDARDFKETATSFSKEEEPELYILSEEKREELRAQALSPLKEEIPTISFQPRDVDLCLDEVRTVCSRTVVTRFIQELKEKPDVNLWVEEGLGVHKKYSSTTCFFCNNKITPERLDALESHFSDEYKNLSIELDQMIDKVEMALNEVGELSLTDQAWFYDDLQAPYKKAREEFDKNRGIYKERLRKLKTTLENKKAAIFDVMKVEDFESPDLTEDIQSINAIIQNHNQRAQSHENNVGEARKSLEWSMVAAAYSEYADKQSEIKKTKEEIDNLQTELGGLKTKIQDLERDIVEHRRPAEELNQDLKSYFGHSELRFEVSDTGYSVLRGDKTATSLSESEKTAIALLYFLKSLEDRDFNLSQSIIVIDDPVSSLDSNSLYNAFGYIKGRVKNAGQLFLLTHNFLFFRQVRDWFKYEKKAEVSFYMLQVKIVERVRKSDILKLDSLLKEYHSEYHYLFKLVYQTAISEEGIGELAQYHYMPNVVRRLLEAFLEFKIPGRQSLYRKLENIDFDSTKRARLLRFVDTHSHTQIIDEAEHDPAILGEVKSVSKDIMDLISIVDSSHFDQMKKLVNSQTTSSTE